MIAVASALKWGSSDAPIHVNHALISIVEGNNPLYIIMMTAFGLQTYIGDALIVCILSVSLNIWITAE
jgi:hypothetical protein